MADTPLTPTADSGRLWIRETGDTEWREMSWDEYESWLATLPKGEVHYVDGTGDYERLDRLARGSEPPPNDSSGA
jgi:hypothetical protein